MEQETLVPEELPPLLVDLLGPYLARQRWWRRRGPPGPVRTIESGCLAELGSPSRRLLVGDRRGTGGRLPGRYRREAHERARRAPEGPRRRPYRQRRRKRLLRRHDRHRNGSSAVAGGERRPPKRREVAAAVGGTVQYLACLRRPADPEVLPPFDRWPQPRCRSHFSLGKYRVLPHRTASGALAAKRA